MKTLMGQYAHVAGYFLLSSGFHLHLKDGALAPRKGDQSEENAAERYGVNYLYIAFQAA
jgi:hypothetical protein